MRELFIKIAESFFGKENVDSTDSYYIIIYFPEIKIRNEYDESRILTDMYVRFTIYDSGEIKKEISIIRGSVTDKEYASGYMHSHVIAEQCFDYFRTLCLGRGPISDTIDTIYNIVNNTNGSCDEMYRLFCVQLKILLETESIEGIPYIRMSSINNYHHTGKFFDFFRSGHMIHLDKKIINFIKELCKAKPLKFSYSCNCYRFAHNDQELTLIITNEYIKYINKNKLPLKDEIKNFTPCIYKNGEIYKTFNNNVGEEKRYEELPIITFNNKPIFFHIINTDKKQTNEFFLLNKNIVYTIVNTLLNLINYGEIEGKFQVI